ncbi:MAG: disulfide bond formation protein B [Steroidobacteraceae bacterium]
MDLLATLRAHRVAMNLLGAAVCAGLMGYALYSQYQLGLEPCPLCIFQRIAVIALGVAFLLAAVVPARARVAGILASLLVGLVTLSGVGVAARHLYIQSLPAGTVPACGATLDYMWDVFPAMEVLRKVFTGSGECAKVERVLGLPMPAWVLICLLALGTFGVLLNWRGRTRKAAW